MANNSTNINKTKESLNIDGQQFTNINKTNNHLSLQIIEHKKKTMTCDAGNPGPGLSQAQKVLIWCSKNQYKLYLIQSNMFKWQPLLSYSQTCSSDNLY